MSGNILQQKQMRSLPLFEGMERDLLDGLITSARFVEHDKGHIFLEEAQPITRFYVVLEGWCGAVKNSASGQESILQIFRTGDFLPEPIGSTAMSSNPYDLQALTKLTLAMLTPSLVRNGLEHSKVFSTNMQVALTQRCSDLRNHIEQLTLHNADQRVGRFLLDMKLGSSQRSKDIVLPFDKSLIAEYLGIKPETLSRSLQFFKDNGFAIDRLNVKAPNEHALCDYCDSVAAQQCEVAHSDECPHHDENLPIA